MVASESTLDLPIRACRYRMSAQIIAKEQRVALVRPSLRPHMQMGGPLTLRRLKVPLFPLASWPKHLRRQVIAIDIEHTHIPEQTEHSLEWDIKIPHRHLHIDNVFGSQP